MPVPFRDEAGLAAGLILYFLQGRPADFLDVAAGDADEMVVMRAVVLELETRGSVSSDHRGNEAALLKRLERAEDRRAAHPVRAKREIDFILA